MPISRTYIAPRFVVMDGNTNLFVVTNTYCDGYDARTRPILVSRLSEATVFTNDRQPKALLSRSKNRFGGTRCHQWEVIPYAEAIRRSTEAESRINNVARPNFPKTLTAAMLKGFITTRNGWTRPQMGRLNGKGPLFVAKFASHTSLGHILNENLTHALYRSCGLHAPYSRVYRNVRFGNGRTDSVLLAQYIAGTPLRDALVGATTRFRETIVAEVLKSYPLDSFLLNYDAYANDNALIDRNGRLWHIDNGSSLNFRATGGIMPWIQNRTDPNDPHNGAFSIYNGECAWKAPYLAKALADINERRLETCWRRFGKTFEGLVARHIPKVARPPHLLSYAKALDALIAKGSLKLHNVVPSAFLNDEHPITRDPGYYDGFQWN